MRDVTAGADLVAQAGEAGARIPLRPARPRRPRDLRRARGPARAREQRGGRDGVPAGRARDARPVARRLRDERLRLGRARSPRDPGLRDAGGGVVCNVTSASLLFPMPFYSVYRASKAAVQALGESLAGRARTPGHPRDRGDARAHRHRHAAGLRPAARGAGHARYRALAEWAHGGRQASEALKTSPAEAARRIADAILDDAAPLRVACDPMGEAMIPAADGPYQGVSPAGLWRRWARRPGTTEGSLQDRRPGCRCSRHEVPRPRPGPRGRPGPARLLRVG